MNPRRVSKAINIGDVTIGGDAPIVVQSMTKTATQDIMSTVAQIKELEECGCQIVRVAVPDAESAQAIKSIKQGVSLPIVADIHFDYRLALMALEAGADGLRLNPGNISEPKKVSDIAQAARERGVPIRIGVNAGSLPKTADPESTIAEQMVDAALKQIRLLESLDFDLIKVSLKAFDVPTTIEAYHSIAQKIPYPLHIGITESGTPRRGVIRSAVGIGTLLYQGIGDTIRVSLTAQEEQLLKVKKPIRVAVMGCVVNGPGEAKDADVGIACGKGKAMLFKKGKKVRTIQEKDFVTALMAEVGRF